MRELFFERSGRLAWREREAPQLDSPGDLMRFWRNVL